MGFVMQTAAFVVVYSCSEWVDKQRIGPTALLRTRQDILLSC